MFVESHDASVTKSAHGRIELKPGALAHIDARNGKMYVKACSGPCAVRVERPNFSANLAPGHFDILKARSTAAEKRIVERMLRTAAAINVATGGRGVYNSKAKPKAPDVKEDGVQFSAQANPFKPVALHE